MGASEAASRKTERISAGSWKSIHSIASWTPVKHTMLGRFRHENVAIRADAGRPVIAYMGDDRTNGHVYRFVSDMAYVPASDANRGAILSTRTFVCSRVPCRRYGRVAGDRGRDAAPAEPRRLDTRHTAGRYNAWSGVRRSRRHGDGRVQSVESDWRDADGATRGCRSAPLRQERLHRVHDESERARSPLPELLRRDLAHRGQRRRNGYAISRGSDGGLAAHPNRTRAATSFAAPDNLSFDPSGNLWVVVDVAPAALNSDRRYAVFQNNGMFFIPTSGPDAGFAMQFASAPCEAELTGPSWTPDRATMFLAVQHPGEAYGMRTVGMIEPRGSNWPSGRIGDPPRPGVVSIRRA